MGRGEDVVFAAAATAAVVGGVAIAWLIGQRRRDDELREQRMHQMLLLALQAQGGSGNTTQHERPSSFATQSDLSTLAPKASSIRVMQPSEPAAAETGTPLRLINIVPSMEDVVKEHEAEGRRIMKLSPQEVLASLQQGNTRFWMGLATRPETSAMERRAMIMRQFPKVAILGCSDSRVPIEIVFDQGLGDVFAIRVAGNAYGTGAAASIDYAVQHLKVKVVMVLGHEGCGAVRAAQLKETEIANEPPALKEWLSSMKNAMDTKGLDNIHDARARDREAVMSNVRTQLGQVSRSKLIQSKVRAGELLVVGAFYEISSGMVDFMDPVALCGDAGA